MIRRIVTFAIAATLTAGVVTALLPDADYSGDTVQTAQAGKRNCVRTGGVRWCFSSTTANYIPVMLGTQKPGKDLAAQLACSHLVTESNANTYALGCDDPANPGVPLKR